MTWVLVLVLIHPASTDTMTVPGFATEADCQRIGQAWAAKINRREDNGDLPVFRCRRADTPLRQ